MKMYFSNINRNLKAKAYVCFAFHKNTIYYRDYWSNAKSLKQL